MPKQTQLAKVIPAEQPNNLPAVAYYPPIPMQQEFEPEAPAVPLSHYLWILRRHRWNIAAFVATCVLVTAVISARLQPIYESTATVDIDRQAPSEVVGQDSTRSSVINDADQFLATQIKLIQSDAVLRPVAEQFHLLDREGQLKRMSPEKAQETVQSPVVLSRLKVTRPPNTYLLLISYRSPDPSLAANVANAIANSYLAHTYDIRIRSSASLSTFMEKQLDELKAKMEKSSLALAQFEKDLNVINPEEKTNILSARLLQLNTEYTTAQGERVNKEAAWNAMKSGSLEAAQVSSQGQDLAKLSDSLNQARQRFALVKSTYGSTHPEYRKAAAELAEVERQFESTRSNIAKRIEVEYRAALNREQMLQKTVAETKKEWDLINSRSFEYQQLKREADADKNLYDELIRKIREADINAGFQNNNIRIADLARPPLSPVYPNLRLNLMLAFLFSTLLAVGAALLQDTLDTTLRDPNEASRFLGTDVIGTMPVDRLAAQLPRSAATVAAGAIVAKPPQSGKGKNYYRSTSDFEEAVRTIRNTILLSDFEGRLRSIVITSAAPGEGKTTIAAHLAIANADRGKKTLIVDGDLRRPSLHAKFGFTPREGLSNVLTGELAWQDIVLPVEGKPNLSLLPAGLGSHRAADLIGPRLSTLLDEFSKEFDLVILDSPPLLGFAECLQIATAADGVLIISQAGETRRRAVAEVIAVLNRLRANIVGVVLNQVSQNTSADGYSYYGYYRYGHYKYGQSQ
ncbi:MAG: polysaccharide biosynthesis tyrosine autokinase [Terracidiphilus sp.]|jgi:capsular exopolysaccharide synthesis family protein